jgi:pimeloyl-ACP methyl ester carboxylesterase
MTLNSTSRVVEEVGSEAFWIVIPWDRDFIHGLAMHEILANDGYNITAAQPPLTGLEDDVAAVSRVLRRQDGPTIFVGHSYGGAIITEAGIDPHVVALVFIAAHAPDVGETQTENGKRFPCACRKSNSHIHMMKSAKKWRRQNVPNGMYCSRRRRVLVD